MPFLDDKNARTRGIALRALGQLDDPRVLDHLHRQLKDEDEDIRRLASEYIFERLSRANS